MCNIYKLKSSLSLMVFLVFAVVLFTTQLSAQTNLTVLNYSFELPDSGKIKGFDGLCADPSWEAGGGQVENIHGWNSDIPTWDIAATNWDSGIEEASATEGTYAAFLMGGDAAIYQNLTRRVLDGDMIKLTVDARNSWMATTLHMELFYLDGDTATAPRVTIVSEDKAMTDVMTPYFITFNAVDFSDAVGKRMGILFDNVSTDSASWIYIDNVQLTNEDPTIINLVNFSFEQPDSYLPYVDGPGGSGKIKGWNGPGSCSNIVNPGAGDAEIPGWGTDTVLVFDSGIDARGQYDPQEGQFIGFLMGSDTSVWNTTDYLLQEGDAITLTVSARNVYAATTFYMELYYVDESDQRIFFSFDNFTISDTWTDYQVVAFTSDDPASYGRPLGVLLDNMLIGSSWIDFDNVRLNANHPVVGVYDPSLEPTSFSLSQNYPNPFNPSTKISYSLSEQSKVRLTVFDILGREVAVLVNREQGAGTHNVVFNAQNLSSGIYFYTLQSSDKALTQKMILLK